MVDNQYKRRFRVLGKLAYLYDQASSLSPASSLKKIAASLFDQTAYGDDGSSGITDAAVISSLDFMNAMAPSLSSLYTAISGMSGTSIQNIVRSLTDAYVTTAAFYDGSDESPANPFDVLPTDVSSPANIMSAFATQMETDVKTVTDSGSIQSFIDTLYDVELPGDSDSPSYADTTYYVGTIISPDV